MKNTNSKNRSSKPQNINRFTNKSMSIKQEIDDDIEHLNDTNLVRPMDFLESIAKSNKKDKDNNLLQNVISNGQSFSLTEAGKLVLNTYKDQQNVSSSVTNNNTINSKNNKLITIIPQSNIVLLSNNQNVNSKSDSNNSPIKVMSKKPVFTDMKNAKAIPVNKLPIFQGKSPFIKRYVITNNPNQQQSSNNKDDDIKKLNDEIRNLKKELEDYKELIIAKDLEIEKLRKKFNNNLNDYN